MEMTMIKEQVVAAGTEPVTALEALQRLLAGNRAYLSSHTGLGDISPAIRLRTQVHGQHPYAIIICCSDSRMIPDAIFSAGIGDLFVIRVAGNVIDDHQLGSIEYAAEHLGCKLIMVLGHTHCGAVDAAMHHEPTGYTRLITDEIRRAIGDEQDPYRASCLNVRHSREVIENSLLIDENHLPGVEVTEAIYHIDTGLVEVLPA